MSGPSVIKLKDGGAKVGALTFTKTEWRDVVNLTNYEWSVIGLDKKKYPIQTFAAAYSAVHPPANLTPAQAEIRNAAINAMNINAKAKIAASTAQIAANEYAEKKRKEKASANQPPVDSNDGYIWNLPPHLWSMPLRATDTYDAMAKTPLDANRRGRIRWYATNQKQAFSFVNPTTGKPETSSPDVKDRRLPRKYGFQFMWNPESFSTSVALNADMLPSLNDQWTTGPGYFPAVESISLTIRLDRTNDFACFRGESNVGNVQNLSLKDWYKDRMPKEETSPKFGAAYNQKVEELMKFGTMADLEYLFMAINDPSILRRKLANGETSDVGFLSATLLKFELGPLEYVGYISGLAINHTAFTEDYIPVRTDVTITANFMSVATPLPGTAGGRSQ